MVNSPLVVVNTTLPDVDPAVAAGNPVNCEPSPIYVPKDDVEVALPDKLPDIISASPSNFREPEPPELEICKPT